MGVVLVAITAVMHHGVIIKPGEEFSCELNHAKKLVAGGSAEMKVKDEFGQSIQTDKDGENEGGHGEDPIDPTFELIAKLNEINVPLLKELAKKHGVELDSDDKKPQIIKKLMAVGVKLDEENV